METNEIAGSTVDARFGVELEPKRAPDLDNKIQPYQFQEMLRQAWLTLNSENKQAPEELHIPRSPS